MCRRLTSILALALVVCGIATAAASADVGFQDESWSGTGTPTGTKRAESLLWFNAGSWWAIKWSVNKSDGSKDFHIFQLDKTTQRWVDTGVLVDSRENTHADVLWDGTHLYIASHRYVSDQSPAAPGPPAYLYRFSYDPVSQRYSPDWAKPVVINNMKTETLVIDKDSTGQLWATWQQDNRIYINRTIGADDKWGAPFALPAAGSVDEDDNSVLIAFGGNRIGVMWSNQIADSDGNTSFNFAVHNDGAVDTAWSASEAADTGKKIADDHINLHADSGGRVYAAVKTSKTGWTDDQTKLLVRDPAGAWARYPIATVAECPNRTLALIDEENRVIHTFGTYPAPGHACSSTSTTTYGGAIYEKTSPLDAISFALGFGTGTPVMVDDDTPRLHNVSSTKQNVSSATGIATIAATDTGAPPPQEPHYWHAFEPIVPAAPTARTFAPVADADVNDVRPTVNYGKTAALRVRDKGSTTATATAYRSYLMFTVSGVSGAVRSAKLRLYVTDPSPDGGSAYSVDNSWTEPGITWNNKPQLAAPPLASARNVALNTWIELDVTRAVTGNGTYSFGIASNNTALAQYDSRESAHPPQLVVTAGP